MANRYWVGGTGNWDDTAHWSAVSGGAGGASVPADGDSVYIDANSNSAGDFTIHINIDTANLYQCKITYPSSKGQVYIVQDYSSSLGRCYDFKCYYGSLNNDYLNGGLISGNSTTDYAKTRWQKGQSNATARMYLTRFVWWGNMTTSDDGFTLASSDTDAFSIHIYGSDCQKNTRAFVFRIDLYIHTPKTVSYTHDGGTWYGCDISFSQDVIGIINTLYIYSNCKLCCDNVWHNGRNPAVQGLWLYPTTSVTLETGAELDTGICYNYGTAGQTYTLPLTTYPRFCRWRVLPNGTVYINNDIIISTGAIGYVSFEPIGNSGAQAIVDMMGHTLRTKKLVMGPSSLGVNDTTCVVNTIASVILKNIGTLKTSSIYVGSSSTSPAVNKLDLSNTTLLDNYAGDNDGSNLYLYTGEYTGSIVDATNCTGTLYINALDMSDTTYSKPSQFYAPATGTWIQKGNINFGSKAMFYHNNGRMTLGNNITFTNNSNNSHFNKINFGPYWEGYTYYITVNNKLEFQMGAGIGDNNIKIGTSTAWALCKYQELDGRNAYVVWGALNWASPTAYPLPSASRPQDGINLYINKSAVAGSYGTTFTWDTDAILHTTVLGKGATCRVATGKKVQMLFFENLGGTISRASGYGGDLFYYNDITIGIRITPDPIQASPTWQIVPDRIKRTAGAYKV